MSEEIIGILDEIKNTFDEDDIYHITLCLIIKYVSRTSKLYDIVKDKVKFEGIFCGKDDEDCHYFSSHEGFEDCNFFIKALEWKGRTRFKNFEGILRCKQCIDIFGE